MLGKNVQQPGFSKRLYSTCVSHKKNLPFPEIGIIFPAIPPISTPLLPTLLPSANSKLFRILLGLGKT